MNDPSTSKLDPPGRDNGRSDAQGRMTRAQIVQEILQLVRRTSPRSLAEPEVARQQRRLHDGAVRLFGRWDVALATALRDATGATRRAGRPGPGPAPRRPPTPSPRSSVPAVSETPTTTSAKIPMMRQPHPDALREVVILTERGHALRVSGEALLASDAPTVPQRIEGWRDAFGVPLRVIDTGLTEELVGIAADGRAFGFSPTVIPEVTQAETTRRLGEPKRIERWLTLLDPHGSPERAQLLVHVTRDGKLKLSPFVRLEEALAEHGEALAFELDEGDEAIDAWLAERSDNLLLASSSGHVISFELDDLRAAPLDGVGVRAMQLEDDAWVVGGVVATRGQEVAFVTRNGLARRVSVDDFRVQSRGGPGQVCGSLEDEDDRLAALSICHPSTDLVVLTDLGRALRLPAPAIPLVERNSSGEQVVDLEPGEHVSGLSRVLPLAFANTSPNAFEI